MSTWNLVPRARRSGDAISDVVELAFVCTQLEEHLRQRLDTLVSEWLLLERALLAADAENR